MRDTNMTFYKTIVCQFWAYNNYLLYGTEIKSVLFHQDDSEKNNNTRVIEMK